MLSKIYLKKDANDIYGNFLNIELEYTVIAPGKVFSVISNGYCDIVINNKYIKKQPRD